MKFKYLIITFLSMFLFILPVKAASFNLSASVSSVSPNGTFTVSVGGDSIGRVNLYVNNGTINTTSVWVEQNYQTITVKAGSSGSVTITATPEVGFSDSDANEYNPGSRTVSVSIITPQKPSTPSQTRPTSPTNPSNQTTTDKKSNNNNLSSLSINSGKLEPNFNASITTYSVNLSSDVTIVNISAKSEDNKAKVSGIGEIKVKPGNNTMEVSVTAENGSKKTYVIKAYVEEKPQVYFNYKNKKIGVIRNLEGVKIPDGFIKKDYKIDNYTISLFTKDDLTIFYGVDDDNKSFYLFDEEEKKCINKFIPLTINNKTLYFIDSNTEEKGFLLDTITIDNQKLEGKRYEKGLENYFILSTINSEGYVVKYLYETTEKTIQLYPEFEVCEKKTENNNIVILILSILLTLFIIITCFLLYKLKGGKHEKSI